MSWTPEQRQAYLKNWRKAHPDNISKHRENEAVKRLRAAGYTVIPPQAESGTNKGRREE